MTQANQPVEPPESYDPSFGSKDDYIRATLEFAKYWRAVPHAFEPCRQCPDCRRCFKCAEREAANVHTPR